MFENEKNEEYWLDLAREHGESLGVDTREGSVYMDMQAGHCFRIAKFYDDLDRVFEMMAIDTCSGDILKEKAAQDDIHFYKAAPSYWTADFIGSIPEDGSEFLCGDYYFTWKEVNNEVLSGFYLVSNDAGTVTNILKSGTELVPMDNIDDLEAATLGYLVIEGVDEEDDEHLRNRWKNQKANRTANGNIQHYKTWCEDIKGIGRAMIFPLFAGANTVKAVLFSSDGLNVSEELVQNVQNYVDPIEKGYEVIVDGERMLCGDGMGMGVANLGAHFLAVSAKPFELRITAPITLSDGYTKDTAETSAAFKIKEYLKKLALETNPSSNTIVRISTIGSMIADMQEITDYDYSELKINGKSENIIVEFDSVAVLSEVVFDVES